MERIDAHHHLWDLNQPAPFDYGWLDGVSHAPIRRSYLPADLWPELTEQNIHATVLVQTQHSLAENVWALRLADQHPWIAGVVGWLDLAADNCAEQLRQARQHPKFVGVRHVVQDEPDERFLFRPEILRGLQLLERERVPYDLLFYAFHLPQAALLARQLPELKLVVDHLSKPRVTSSRQADWISWRQALQDAASCPNVYCKLSGLVTEANWDSWTVDELRPYFTAAIEAFSPARCLFGSDWPVCLLAATYDRVVEALTRSVENLSASEQASIWGGTAKEFYGLNLAAGTA